MTWPPLALVFLGTIALASLLQTARRVRNAGEVAEKMLVRPLAAAAILFAVYRAFRRVTGERA